LNILISIIWFHNKHKHTYNTAAEQNPQQKRKEVL